MLRTLSANFIPNPENDVGMWLELLGDAAHAPVEAQRMAILVAHPDDETVGCGAQLCRLRDASLIVLTDGAPRDLRDARKLGFDTAEEYAAARLTELQRVLELSGFNADNLAMCNVPDQQAALQLPQLVAEVSDYLRERQIRCVITHAYEGGHPDHDAAAFVAHLCVTALARERYPLRLVEMPLYRASIEGPLLQAFMIDPMTPIDQACEFALNDDEQQLKRSLLAVYATQHEMLKDFAVQCERFRAAPRYNFGDLPNWGRLLYENRPWGMTGHRWLGLTRDALNELGLIGAWH